MQYNPKNKALLIETKDADTAAGLIQAAIHYHRKSHGIPLEGYKLKPGETLPGDPHNTTEYCLLMTAKALGIDIGSTRPGELDVRDAT